MNEEQSVYVDRYFAEQVYPVLTPMAVDSSRPFPLIRNKSLNIAALIRRKDHGSRLLKTKGKKDELEFATVQVPSVPAPSGGVSLSEKDGALHLPASGAGHRAESWINSS